MKKAELFRHAQKLKDSRLSRSDDYSKEVRDKNRHLREYAKAKKEQGEPSHVVKHFYDKLIIDINTAAQFCRDFSGLFKRIWCDSIVALAQAVREFGMLGFLASLRCRQSKFET